MSTASVLGVVRMAQARSPWRALRPVLLAGAATLTWLTFSTAPASADSLLESGSLLGGPTSSVGSVAENSGLAAPAQPVPSAPAGLPESAVTTVSGAADSLISAVPIAAPVVPAGAVMAITAPVGEVVETAASQVVATVVAPVVEAAPVLEPVLQPVSGLVAGVAAVPLPDVPVVSLDLGLPSVEPESDAVPLVETPSTLFVPASSDDVPGTSAVAVELVVSSKRAWSLGDVTPSRAASSSTGGPAPDDPGPLSAQTPAVPGSGSGSSSSSSGHSGPAAGLDPDAFVLPAAGEVLAADASEHAPAPVSFDPGSSPD